MTEKTESDVLVVGAGGAGLRAAIEADARGAEAVIVSKAPSGMNNATVVSGGGFRAAIGGLTPEEYTRDTIEVGKGINDRRLVEVVAREGERRLLELRRFGVDLHIRRGGAHVEGLPTMPGYGLTKPLVDYARSKGITLVENVVVTKLLIEEGGVVGAVGYDARRDEPVIFSSKAVVLATGGAGAIYRRTDCPLRTTGDGYSLAYHAGARLRDMEFVQFFPMALAEPGHPPYLIGGPVSEEGRIMNSLGDDIPRKHGLTARPLVLKSRDMLSRAIMREILEGRGVGEAVLVDATAVFRGMAEGEWNSTGAYAYFRDRLRAAEKPFRVAPICHFCMGGIVADEYGDTGVRGLYAAGEVCGGVHGANRHGGNALTDIIVFGARAGAAAAEYAETRDEAETGSLVSDEMDRFDAIRRSRPNEEGNPQAVMARLRELMWREVGIVRDGTKLKEAIKELEGLRKSIPHLHASSGRLMLEALEVPMALDAAEMIARAALKRTESRGAHYRTDYPETKDTWLRPVIIRRGRDGEMSLTARAR